MDTDLAKSSDDFEMADIHALYIFGGLVTGI